MHSRMGLRGTHAGVARRPRSGRTIRYLRCRRLHPRCPRRGDLGHHVLRIRPHPRDPKFAPLRPFLLRAKPAKSGDHGPAIRPSRIALSLRLLAVVIVVLGTLPASVAAPICAAICGHATTAGAPTGPDRAVAVRGDAAIGVAPRTTKKVPLPDPLDAVLPEIAPPTTPTAAVGREQRVPRAPPRSPDPILRPAAHGPPAFA
jgi:hypothetical protein